MRDEISKLQVMFVGEHFLVTCGAQQIFVESKVSIQKVHAAFALFTQYLFRDKLQNFAPIT